MRTLIFTIICLAASAIGYAADEPTHAAFPLKLEEIHVRDPFIYADADSHTYCLYAQTVRGPAGQAM